MPDEASLGDAASALGTFIRTTRERLGVSQAQLAAKTGIDPSYLALIEAGKRAKPAADILQRIADALQIDSGTLLAFLGVRQDLPEPRLYLRRKYGLNSTEADALAQLIEHQLQKRKGDAGDDKAD
ncbi:helix-turn-helix domain-containing protein [Fodinicola acaciae]|uniref:helix-turn-helix domain-containing protein n=1 Tax=Fodinicola acaciae TaxID=2681555 RepID=UPI0013D6B42E|nr:helix-turn-helix transcriptional regulator [Fodinicola acaciae]